MDAAELDLVRRAKKGELVAFEKLFHQYEKRIFNFILQMIHDKDDSAELTQDTFIRAHHSLHALKSNRAFSSWLYRIALNLVRDKTRKFEPNIESIDIPYIDQDGAEFKVEIPDWSANPREVTLQKELQTKIQTAVSSLPKLQREVVILYHFDGLGIEEICMILDIPNGTVKSRLARARELLKIKLKAYVSS
jgi:RNA polymerase sigma-70 factor (ECF subfamily)